MTREYDVELLPIIQAYAEEKEIQYRIDNEWITIENEKEMVRAISNGHDMRIKPEPKYRPFKDCDELIATWAKMMGCKAKENTMPLIWVRDAFWVRFKENKSDTLFFIMSFDTKKNLIRLGNEWFDFTQAYERFCFLDGSPFGVCE